MKRYALLGPFLFVGIWAVIARGTFVDPFFLPDPLQVLRTCVELLANGVFSLDILSTLRRVLAAFLIALMIGLPLGLFLGQKEVRYRSVEWLIDFFRSTPATALFPLFLLMFGVGDFSKIAIAAFSCALIVLFNTAQGVLHAKQSRVLAARLMGANERQIFQWVLFWESLPQTFIGVRSAISWSLVIIVVTEMFIGTTAGLGRAIFDAQITYEIPAMYAAILLTGFVGYLLNLLFLLLEKRVLHWSGK